MKPQRLVPMFILALSFPGYLLAGSGASQKSDCGCSQARKVTQKSSTCGCGATQKHAQKSPAAKCGCGFVHKGKGHGTTQKGTGVIQKRHGSLQKPGNSQKSTSVQKNTSVQKARSTQKNTSVQKHAGGKSKNCGCSKCCLAVIPAVVVNGLECIVSGTLQHLSAAFACNSCGNKGKFKSGLLSLHRRGSKSKSCGCDGSSKVAPTRMPNPFKDDELQAPATPATEASFRTVRRAIHRPIFRTRATTLSLHSEPRTLPISMAKPLTQSESKSSTVLRAISLESRSSLLPHNPLRAK